MRFTFPVAVESSLVVPSYTTAGESVPWGVTAGLKSHEPVGFNDHENDPGTTFLPRYTNHPDNRISSSVLFVIALVRIDGTHST